MSLLRRCLLAVAVVVWVAVPAAAQTSDDLFNPEILQRLDLWLNAAD